MECFGLARRERCDRSELGENAATGANIIYEPVQLSSWGDNIAKGFPEEYAAKTTIRPDERSRPNGRLLFCLGRLVRSNRYSYGDKCVLNRM